MKVLLLIQSSGVGWRKRSGWVQNGEAVVLMMVIVMVVVAGVGADIIVLMSFVVLCIEEWIPGHYVVVKTG